MGRLEALFRCGFPAKHRDFADSRAAHRAAIASATSLRYQCRDKTVVPSSDEENNRKDGSGWGE